MPELNTNGDHTQLQNQLNDLRIRLFGFANENWQGGMKGDIIELKAQLDDLTKSLPSDIKTALREAAVARSAGRWASLSGWSKTVIGTIVAGIVVGLLVAAFTVALHLTQVVQVKP